MKRVIAILHNNENTDENVHELVKTFLDNSCADFVFVCTKDPTEKFNITNGTQFCQNLYWPAECDNIPKIRNWINDFFKKQNFKGMLHIIEDNTKLLKIPNGFIYDLERMMKTLDYNVWFSTICDRCNYVYNKYNPRLSIALDKPGIEQLELGKQLLFTSHSNTQWIVYNFEKISDDLLKFNEDFTISMFYIIEFLARRRNTRKNNELYFMNQYLTVESEYGTYKNIEISNEQDDQNVLKEEDTKFRSMNIDIHPDNNIDNVLEMTYKKLLEKKQ
jgi:hypothetical protein